jgi:hypothetical protein
VGTGGNEWERVKVSKVAALREKPFTPGAAVDLFGLEHPSTRSRNNRPEAAALLEVLKALKAHPAVAWAERMNSGAAKVGNRFIRFGWPGCPDVLGQLKDGRLLGVEVKAPTGRLKTVQALFLERINTAGGVAFVARNCLDVLRELDGSPEANRLNLQPVPDPLTNLSQ